MSISTRELVQALQKVLTLSMIILNSLKLPMMERLVLIVVVQHLQENLEVGGNFRVTNNARVAGVLTINQGGVNEVTLGDGSALNARQSKL